MSTPRKILGGWYIDARPGGKFVCLIPGSHLETHRGSVRLPHGRNLLQVRLAKDGVRFAGTIHDGEFQDHAFEWTGSEWRDHGKTPGMRAVLYDAEDRLVVNNKGEFPGTGIRFISTRTGKPVTADDSIAHASRVWEFTDLGGGLLVGQGGESNLGKDPVCVVIDGVRRLLQRGFNWFINAYLEDGQVTISWSDMAPGSRDAYFITLSLAELRALPEAVEAGPSPAPIPAPTPSPTPPPQPQPMPSQLETVKRIRAKYPTPLAARHWEFLVEVCQAVGAKAFLKPGAIRIPALGVDVSQDVIIFGTEWVDILLDGEGVAEAAWDAHPNAGEPEKWVDVSRVQLPGPPAPAPDPSPILIALANLEAHVRAQNLLIAGLEAQVKDLTVQVAGVQVTQAKGLEGATKAFGGALVLLPRK